MQYAKIERQEAKDERNEDRPHPCGGTEKIVEEELHQSTFSRTRLALRMGNVREEYAWAPT
ncbi:hypothetical protein D3C72_2011530 [compost metagenome]